MSDQWLERFGLCQYADAFEVEQMDFAALPHLTEPMLKEMGLPVGPRAKVLAVIKALRSTETDQVTSPGAE